MTASSNVIKVADIAELRRVQIHLLNELDKICSKHNLRYWLDFGTLLGAVRSGDFIPWDDDIDISMPMDDYKKFLTIAESELPTDVFLQTPKTDPPFNQYFVKLRDCYSTFIETHESGEMPYHQGIFIDIFPCYFYPTLPRLFRKVLQRTTVRTRYAACVTKKHVWFNYPAYYLCKLVWVLLTPLKKTGFGQTPEDNGYMYATPLEHLYPLTKISFAGGNYPAPHNAHAQLANLYGPNYMIPPTESNRVPHAKLILPNTPCNHPRAMTTNRKSNT